MSDPIKITKRIVDAAQPHPEGKDLTYWDSELKGFGLRVQPKGAKSFILMYRTREGRLRKLTIAKVGKLAPDEARSEAKIKLGEIEKGGDPAGDKASARNGLTVSHLCDLYLADAANRIKASTLAMDKSRVNVHVKPLLGRQKVASLTVSDLRRMQADIAAGKTAKMEKPRTPAADGTIPKEKRKRGGIAKGGKGVAARTLGMFSTILEWARKEGYVARNPASDVDRLTGNKRKDFLDADKLKSFGQALRSAGDDEENRTGLAAIRAMLLTGCRRNEILGLEAAWLDTTNQCIRFPDTKSGPQMRVIGATAAEFLATQVTKKGQKWVFAADRGEGHFIGAPKVLKRVCKKADVGKLSLHTLRHTFASTAESLGYSQMTIAGLLGHHVPGVTADYTHLPDAALKAAADKISARIADTLDGRDSKTKVVDHPAKKRAGKR